MEKKLQIASLSFRSIRNLTPKPNHLSFAVCDSVGPSNVQWRGLSHAAAAASVPSETPDSPKGRKRVPKHQRIAMVESFVTKYRSENAGKFPTPNNVMKQVGGGYYVIRKIMQELEYRSKMKSSNNKDEMPYGVKTEESVSSYSDSVAPESHLLQEEIEHVSAPSSENCSKAQDHESEIVDMENLKKLEEKYINDEGYKRKEQPALENLSCKTSHSSPLVPSDMNSVEAVSSYQSDAVGQERDLLKEEKEVFDPFVGKSDSSHSEGQSYESVEIENHLSIEKKSAEKAGYERKEQDVLEDLPDVDSRKPKMEQSHGSLKLGASKMDSSDNREPSGSVVSEKSTLWGNLKSFADGIVNIWRKL